MVEISPGSSSDPGLKFVGTSTGLFLRSSTDMAFSLNGKAHVSINEKAFSVTTPFFATSGVVARPAYAFGSDQGTGLFSAGSGILAVASDKVKVLELIPATNGQAITGTNTLRVMTPASTKAAIDAALEGIGGGGVDSVAGLTGIITSNFP